MEPPLIVFDFTNNNHNADFDLLKHTEPLSPPDPQPVPQFEAGQLTFEDLPALERPLPEINPLYTDKPTAVVDHSHLDFGWGERVPSLVNSTYGDEDEPDEQGDMALEQKADPDYVPCVQKKKTKKNKATKKNKVTKKNLKKTSKRKKISRDKDSDSDSDFGSDFGPVEKKRKSKTLESVPDGRIWVKSEGSNSTTARQALYDVTLRFCMRPENRGKETTRQGVYNDKETIRAYLAATSRNAKEGLAKISKNMTNLSWFWGKNRVHVLDETSKPAGELVMIKRGQKWFFVVY